MGHSSRQFRVYARNEQSDNVALITLISQCSGLADRHPAVFRDCLRWGERLIVAAVFACFAVPNASRADVVGADALVIVNSASARYLDFRNHIQPYLDNFGVPYSVLDIRTDAITATISEHALIIIGHRELDTNHIYFDTSTQNIVSTAVSNGTGLVNFDSALSGDGNSSRYTFVEDIFGFAYTNDTAGSDDITFPATEPGNKLHYITALHSTAEQVPIRSDLNLAGVTLPTGVTAIALRGADPLLMVSTHGQGRAVQWGGCDWMTMTVKGPVAGLDDLVWRSLVWAARKPFVMRGMPPMATLRVDDVSGPTPAVSNTSSLTNWVQVAIDAGFKPYLSLFYDCLDNAEISYIRKVVTNGQATASIHAHGDCGPGGFFYFDHPNLQSWPDNVMAEKFALGTAWHLNNGIPISKVVTPHYSEIGANAFQGLKDWGVEFVQIEIVPGTVEYGANPAPWLVGAPYRLYETPGEGQSPYPFYYADYLSIPNHPELDGWFFNAYTEIRDDAPCQEFCPDNDVTASIGRGTRQLKRAFDSMVMGELFTHDYFFYPIPNNPGETTIISKNTWRAILQGITNGIAGYKPQFVTLDHANQYVRATRTARLTNATYNTVTKEVQIGLGGRADLQLQLQVFVGEGNAISNHPVLAPMFTNNISIGTSSNWPTTVVVPESIRPTLAIKSPVAKQRWSNDVFTVVGTARDNALLTNVSLQLNGSGWNTAETPNGWTNWTANVSVSPGSNFLQAFATDSSGNNSTTGSVSFVYVLSGVLTVQTNGSGTLSPGLNGKLLEIGKAVSMTAKPAARNLFAGWSGSLDSPNPVLTFQMQSNLTLQANFVTNPFVGLKGTFYGLFSDTGEVRNHDRSGAFTLKLAESGNYSASFQLGSKKLAAKGAFDWLGQTLIKLKPSLTETVTVALRLDVTNLNGWVEGVVSNNTWAAPLLGYRAPVYPAGTGSLQAGKYTVIIPGSDDAETNPGGDGYGTVTVSRIGALKLAGKLADGMTVSQAVSVSEDGWWGFYSTLYTRKGSLQGWMIFTNKSGSDINGELSWIKPALTTTKQYPLGFTNEHEAVGSLYIGPTTGRVVNITNGTVEFQHGNLIQPITNSVMLAANNKVTNLSSNKFTMTFTVTSGLFKGSVTDTNTGKAIPFTGALLQKLDSGYGYFLGTNQSGQVRFAPVQ